MTDSTVVICPACGSPGTTGDSYCEACGSGLRSGATAVAGVPCVTCGEEASQIEDGYCRSCGMKQPSPRDRREDVDGNGDVAAVTDRGRRRRRNEDAFAISATPDGRIVAVVSDGVSSTTNSDLASQEAVAAAIEALSENVDADPADALGEAYAAALEAVNWVDGSSGPGSSPSCTFLALTADGSRVDLASVGDCRAFWLPEEGEPETLTEDDSWATEQIAARTMTAAQAHSDARSHAITRWLGRDADPAWGPRLVRFTAPGPGRLVMCSDGLWNYVPSATEIAAIAGSGRPPEVASRLVDYANHRGGQDNITVVVVAVTCPTDPVAAKGPTP